MKKENKVAIIVIVLSIIIFVGGTILDRLYFHQDIELGATLFQNSVEMLLFLIGMHLGMKIKEDLIQNA